MCERLTQRKHACMLMHMHLHTYAQTCLHTLMPLYVPSHPYMHMHMHMCMHIYMYMRTPTHTPVHARTLICMHAYMYKHMHLHISLITSLVLRPCVGMPHLFMIVHNRISHHLARMRLRTRA